MITHWNIQQGTEQWHRIRYGKIGGTLCKGLFVKSDTLLLDLLSEITEEFQISEEPYQSSDMIRGTELEPIARGELSEYIGVKLLTAGWLQCEENELLGISPDGISEDETISAEIKCPNSKTHLEWVLGNKIPSKHFHQCLQYFTVNPKLQKHYFCSFRPEAIKRIFVTQFITRDSIVNIGTESKPITMTVSEAIVLAKATASILKEDIKNKIDFLKF